MTDDENVTYFRSKMIETNKTFSVNSIFRGFLTNRIYRMLWLNMDFRDRKKKHIDTPQNVYFHHFEKAPYSMTGSDTS